MNMKHNNVCNFAQSGRSMVEMLGVLAIVGVLSVGGIAGYSYGMEKYRANQTVNDIMLRAVDLIAQATQGQEALTLSEWQNDSSVYDISSEDYTEDNLIVFDVGIQKKIPQQVCQTIFDTFYTQAFQIDINDKVANTSADCVQENTMTFYFDYGGFSPDGCKTDADCSEGRYCDVDTGFCFRGDKPEGSYGVCTTTNECCVKGSGPSEKHGANCTLSDGTTGMCHWGECLPTGCTYNENKCRGKNEYCASPNAGCTEAFPNGATGTCVEADFTELDVEGKTYYVSYNAMNWWDGDAGCKALGRDGLISVSDLINGWNGADDGKNHELTALGQALQSYLGEYTFIWTNNLIDNSCYARSVNTDNLSIGNYRRHIDYGFAICR